MFSIAYRAFLRGSNVWLSAARQKPVKSPSKARQKTIESFMIIRHDIEPALHLSSPAQFPAVVPVDTRQQEVLVVYDDIDQLLKPSLLPAVQSVPDVYARCDGMGTLIQPLWILSAAHVAVELAISHKIEFANTPYAIQQIIIHPDFYTYSSHREISEVQNDIALIQLQHPVQGIAPLPLYRQTDELRQTATFVGQGDFGTGLIGPDQVDGKMRIATNRIEKVDDQWLIFKFDAPPEATELEGISGPGDGGSPALLKTAQGWAVAGVRAGQDSARLGEGYYGVWEYYTRISHHLDWIDSIMQP
ncbi:trypsin-like serine protease [Leptolyngbya sp. BC1307]|uniref:trypsin-like serine protease n=1 Tax=Leptolyngbya sp. BC1307 TaxID=2029589 RepID=UPI0014825D1A|nr:trypsin-like serine protease [Leptolyngbya sp. BC1307]